MSSVNLTRPTRATCNKRRLVPRSFHCPRLLAALCVKRISDMSKRRDNIRRNVGAFLKQYRRKAHAGHDPNDRQYSREMEKRIKSMNPEELSEVMAGEDESILLVEEEAWFSGENPVGVLYSLNQTVQIENVKLASIISFLIKLF